MTKHPIAVVTGAAGFIGSHMVDLLRSQNYRVHGIDNLASGCIENLKQHKNDPDLVLEIKDLCDIQPDNKLFKRANFVFHFAGIGDIVPSLEKPTNYMSANVMGTIHALEAARHAQVNKFIYAASSSCYGLTTKLPTTESAPIDPKYPYALSKYLAERSVLHWGQVYHLPVNSLRIFNAYGPRSRTTGVYGAVFGVFLAQKLAGLPFTVVGDGTQKRDFVFVTDVARAFLAAANTNHVNEIYNLGAGQPQSVNRLVELIGGEVTHVPDRPGEPKVTWADISKIQDHLNWSPEVSFEDGVKIMLDNIDYWKDAPLWDPESIKSATETWFKFLSNCS